MPARCALVAGLTLLLDLSILGAQSPQVPVFRSQATLVPLDVHVVDGLGRPITDLTAADFTVLENDVRQHISHFVVQQLAAVQLDGARRTPPAGPPNADGLMPQTGRVFLIVLGRGRLQEPSDGLDALIYFAGHQLLPQDYAAVLAYNRATRFTRNHEAVVGVLERFKAKNDWLDTRLRSHFRGLQALFSKEIPSYIQSEIDAIFPSSDRVATTHIGLSALSSNETQATAGSLFERDARVMREVKAVGFEMFDQLLPEGGFNAYVANARAAMDDLEKILRGIEYLGRFSGEKHLLFVTEKGFFMPHEADGDAALARAANDARVAIDIIQTGGLEAPAGGEGWTSLESWSPLQSIVNIAHLSGGQSSRFDPARDALDKLDRATRTGYLIGYYPSDSSFDGRYRRLEVRVNRRGATVLFRHGYDATNEPVVDLRAMRTTRRVSAALAHAEDVEDVNLRLDATLAGSPAGATEVVANLVIASSDLSWVEQSGKHVVTLDVAIFVADSRERIIGESRKRATLRLSDDTFKTTLSDGLRYAVRVAVKGTPRFVKAIVYDYGADVLGSRMKRLK